jgi:hypothetical protein
MVIFEFILKREGIIEFFEFFFLYIAFEIIDFLSFSHPANIFLLFSLYTENGRAHSFLEKRGIFSEIN